MQCMLQREICFSEKETLRLGVKLISGLESLHKNGFVHGDIQPSNIMYKDDNPYFIDF